MISYLSFDLTLYCLLLWKYWLVLIVQYVVQGHKVGGGGVEVCRVILVLGNGELLVNKGSSS